MSLRVIAGKAKGRRLKLVPGDSTRPIMDRVKEALFNIIGRDILDATFLDLFAGTGSVGIEALSRGAAHAVFIDTEREAIKTIRANLALTGLADHAEVLRTDAFAYLARQSSPAFDFIYVAPPQYRGLWKQTLETLDRHPDRLHEHSRVIVQIDPREYETVTFTYLSPYDERTYGKTRLIFFEAARPRQSLEGLDITKDA